MITPFVVAVAVVVTAIAVVVVTLSVAIVVAFAVLIVLVAVATNVIVVVALALAWSGDHRWCEWSCEPWKAIPTLPSGLAGRSSSGQANEPAQSTTWIR